MADKLTRRQLGAALAATPLVAQTRTPEAPATAPTSTPADPAERARTNMRRNSEGLARVQLGMAVEPSFAFKP